MRPVGRVYWRLCQTFVPKGQKCFKILKLKSSAYIMLFKMVYFFHF